MDRKKTMELAKNVLDAWNRHDVEGVLSCYTEDCVYLDPNTDGPVNGHKAFRKYLTRLFEQWQMHWTLREFYLFSEEEGGGFLWHAELTPVKGGSTVEINGMDLVMVEGDRLSRNEVYFDRMPVLRALK